MFVSHSSNRADGGNRLYFQLQIDKQNVCMAKKISVFLFQFCVVPCLAPFISFNISNCSFTGMHGGNIYILFSLFNGFRHLLGDYLDFRSFAHIFVLSLVCQLLSPLDVIAFEHSIFCFFFFLFSDTI